MDHTTTLNTTNWEHDVYSYSAQVDKTNGNKGILHVVVFVAVAPIKRLEMGGSASYVWP